MLPTMKIHFLILTIFVLFLADTSQSYNTNLIKKFKLTQILSPLSDNMKTFLDRTIDNYSSEKCGFLLLYINEVPHEYKEYLMGRISENSSAAIMNLYSENNNPSTFKVLNFYFFKYLLLYLTNMILFLLQPGKKHVKLAIIDPTDDLSHTYYYFNRIRLARAKIIVLCTKKPSTFNMQLIFLAYWSVKCLNVVLIFESAGKIEVFTFNPFVSPRHFLVQLEDTDELFPDKLRNMDGYQINALYLMQDRTKVRSC